MTYLLVTCKALGQSPLWPDQYRSSIKSPVLLYSSDSYNHPTKQFTTISMSTNNSTRKPHFVNRCCFCNTELRTATITKIKGLSIQTQQNTFVLFTLFKLTLDERKTLTKISTRKTSHNHSPNQRTPWTTKKQRENPPLEGKQQVTEKSCLQQGRGHGYLLLESREINLLPPQSGQVIF